MPKQDVCLDCGTSLVHGKTGRRLYCDACRRHRLLESKRAHEKRRRAENKEEYKKKGKERYWRTQTTPEAKAARAAALRKMTLERKRLIFQHYGQRCACCGETTIEFLSIDHVNGGGNQHRKEVGSNLSFYGWVIRNNFPDSLRLLCFNCNMARGFYGYCPHEKK